MSDTFKTSKVSLSFKTIFEMWVLTALFVVVIGGLLQLKNQQVLEQGEVARSMQLEQSQNFNELSRNNTPALGY